MENNVWIASAKAGLISPSFERLLPDAYLLAADGKRLFCALREKGMVLNTQTDSYLNASPGLEAMSLSGDGRFLYELSGECDSLMCLDVLSGHPLFWVKSGCYPQGLHMHPTQPLIAVAAGATSEILVYETPQLSPFFPYRVPGIASRVTFNKHGIVFLSAVEKGDLHTLVGLIRQGNPSFEEFGVYKGVPGAICSLPDESVVFSFSNTLMRVRLRPYKVLFVKHMEGLITSIDYQNGLILLCDSAMGTVSTLPVIRPYMPNLVYEGDALHAIFMGNV